MKKVNGVMVKPFLSQEVLSPAQIDLFKKNNNKKTSNPPNNVHKWSSVYQEQFTKYCILRILTIEETGCESICGAPNDLRGYGIMMMR